MTHENDASQAAPRSSGWAEPQGGAPKKSSDKWVIWMLLAGYASLYAVVSWISSEYVQTASPEGGVLQIPRASGPLLWAGLAFMPLYVLAKVGFTAVCLALGAAIIEWKVRFSRLFHAAMLAEVVWIVAEIARLVWMLVFPGTDAFFYPLSVLSLVTLDQESMWAIYILRVLNLFEIAYMALLAYSMRLATEHLPYNVGLFVVVSYGSGMLILVSAVTFFLLSIF